MYDTAFSPEMSVWARVHGIQNGTRHSESLIKCYRKAILSKVTCVALHQLTVMSILKPKQRQVALVLLFSSVSITNTASVLVSKRKKKRKKEIPERNTYKPIFINNNFYKHPVKLKLITNSQFQSIFGNFLFLSEHSTGKAQKSSYLEQAYGCL